MTGRPEHRSSSAQPGTESALGNLQLGLDAVTILLSMWAASNLHAWLQSRLSGFRVPPGFDQYATLVYLALPLWLVLIAAFRLHLAVSQRIGQAELLVRLLKVHVLGLAVLSVVQFTTHAVINRSLIALFMLATFVAMHLQRTIMLVWAQYQYARGIGRERLLLVGQPSRRMAELVRAATQRRYPAQLLGYLEAPVGDAGLSVPPSDMPALPCIGKLADLARVLHDQPVDHVMFFPPANHPDRVREQLLACEAVGVSASFSVDLVQLADAMPRVTTSYDHAFVTFDVSPKRTDALAIKYGLDPILAGLAILALSPLLLVITLCVLVTMGRPVFFGQLRGGLFGRPFRMLKFRSMQRGAEDQRSDLASSNEMSGPVFKIKDDPRVTSLGRVLRRTSLDELPQLFNVLTGSMSLVGPRPLPVDEQAQIQGWQRRRLAMKPGITCLWQVGGRNNVAFVDWMMLDLKYIDEWSLWLDLQILLRTIPVVLFSRGAS